MLWLHDQDLLLWIALKGWRLRVRLLALFLHIPFSWLVRDAGRRPGDSWSGSLMHLGEKPLRQKCILASIQYSILARPHERDLVIVAALTLNVCMCSYLPVWWKLSGDLTLIPWKKGSLKVKKVEKSFRHASRAAAYTSNLLPTPMTEAILFG